MTLQSDNQETTNIYDYAQNNEDITHFINTEN
jgi:hypothetical protein